MREKKAPSPSLDILTPRRRTIKPATDESVDPIEKMPQVQSAVPVAPPRSGRRPAEATVQLNARISLEVEGYLQETLQHTGMLKRAVVEQALTEFWEREVKNAR